MENLKNYKGLLISKIKYIFGEISKDNYLKDLSNYAIILKKDPKYLDVEIDRILLLVIRECECYKKYHKLKKIISPVRRLDEWNLINSIDSDILDEINKYLTKKLDKGYINLLVKHFNPPDNALKTTIKSKNNYSLQITPKQLNYILDLIDINPNGRKILKEFLEDCSKENIKNLTKKEASKLIELLLSPKIYKFPCGLNGKIYEYKSYGCLFADTLSTEFEMCIYFCPKRIKKISTCNIWKSKASWDKKCRFVYDSFQDAVQYALNITGDLVEIGSHINDYLKEIDKTFEYLGFGYDAHLVEYDGIEYSIDLCKRTIKRDLRDINGNSK